MPKERGDVWARFTESEAKLEDVRRATQNPSLQDGEAEVRVELVAFLALLRSCVTMPNLKHARIDEILKKWSDPEDRVLFCWLRSARDDSLKEGAAILITKREKVDQLEYARRHPGATVSQPTLGTTHAAPPDFSPQLFVANTYEVDIEGSRHLAFEVCRRGLELVRRFLVDAEV